MILHPLRPDFVASRSAAQSVAVHILARTRHTVTGRIDLAPTPGGVGTPVFGPTHRVLRLSGDLLIDETTASDGPSTRILSWTGLTLEALADFVGTDLSAEFSAGHDTPAVTDGALQSTGGAITQLGDWYAFGLQVLDRTLGDRGDQPLTTRARIWPEHFDLGVDIAAPNGQRVNLGASPGDGSHAAPYLYVAPWDADRPGDPSFWNAPFGAVLGYDDVRVSTDAVTAGVQFLAEGINRFA